MKEHINSWAAWMLLRIQFTTANFDPEVLQWPGGSLIAFFLSLYATARSFEALCRLLPIGKHLPSCGISSVAALGFILGVRSSRKCSQLGI